MLVILYYETEIYHGHVFNQDDDCTYMTINLNHGYCNLQVVDISKGVGRGDDDDNDDKIDDNGDEHIDLEGALRII